MIFIRVYYRLFTKKDQETVVFGYYAISSACLMAPPCIKSNKGSIKLSLLTE